MRVTRTAGIQCVIVLMVLFAEIAFSGRYHAVSDMDRDTGLQGEEADKQARKVILSEESILPGEGILPEGVVEPAKIVWEEVPAELTETEFVFGGIRMVLPEKSRLEYQKREDGAVAACVSATENPSLLRKLYFTHYRAEWNCKWELVLAAMELAGEERANCFSLEDRADWKDCCFGLAIRGEEGEKWYYILVWDEELYLLEDHSAGEFQFRFEDEYGPGNLFWGDTGSCVEMEKECFVYRLNEKDGIFLLSEKREGDGKSLVWQNGNAAGPLQILEGEAVVCGDINFDGYPDIEVYDGEKKESSYFLWDEAKSQFVRAVIPADETEGISIEKKLDEFKTFWGYGDVRDEEYRMLKSTEKLYQWDDTVLKEIRSISCRFEEEKVVITLTDAESGECFGEGTFAVKGWETNPEVRELYAWFYQGYAPKELYYMRHDAPGEEQVIPESLVKELLRAYEEDREIELLESLETGRKLSDSEKEVAAVESADIARVMEDMDSAHVKMIRADLDNDGVEDIFAEVDFGGSGPFGEYILYRGNEAGEYKKTGLGMEEYVRKPFYVICFEGKNYVCHHKTESGKIWTGLILEGYRDGELAETVSFDRVPGPQTDSVIFCRDSYRDMARKELEKAPKIYDQRKKYIASEGDAEQRVEEGTNIFVSDIDNDGMMEKYIKHIIDHPTDFFGLEMEDKAGKTEAEPAIPDCRDEAGVQVMMWVDACDGKNIMNVIYRTGLYDYMVEGFLLDDAGGCNDLYAIERKTELEVETVRTWELPGKRSRIP